MRDYYPLTFEKACFAKFLVLQKGWSTTKTALRLQLNPGSVSRAVHGVRFPEAPPLDPDKHGEN